MDSFISIFNAFWYRDNTVKKCYKCLQKIDDATYIICVRCKIALHNSCEETYGHKYYTICPRCDRGGSLGTMYAPDKIK
jgi:hypothetical protein